jgi:uncharacterized RDD family membrane protein YckC
MSGMAKLIVNPTSSARREIPLARALLSIGRDPSNDVVLPDAMVSRRHAVIECRGSQYFIRDCNSSNGSLVNGDRVSERGLKDGDLVAIGTARLLFREDMTPEEAAAKVVQHPSSPRLECPVCQADYRKGDVFCRQCGASLAPSAPQKAVCSACGTVVVLPARFCNACGKGLEAAAPRPDATRPHPIPADPSPDPDPGPGPRESPPPRVPEPEPRPPVEAAPAPQRGGSRVPAPAPVPPPGPAPLPRPAGSAATAHPAPSFPPPAGPRPVPPSRAAETRVEPSHGEAQAAGFGSRLLAGLIDAAVVGVVQLVVLAPAMVYWWTRETPQSSADVGFWPILLSLALVPLALALGAVYYIYYWGVKGATPGKRVLDLIVQAEDGAHPIGVPRASMRLLGYILSGALFGIGFLMIALGGSALHDRLAGTRVVRWRRT